MFVAIRQYKIRLDAVETVTRQIQDGFIPLISQAPGFVEYYWLNAGNGFVVSLSIFEDQAGAAQSTEMATDYIRQHLATLFRNPPEVIEGEVLLHHAGGRGQGDD